MVARKMLCALWCEIDELIQCQKEAVQSFHRETKSVVVFVSRHQEGSRGIIYNLRRPVGRGGVQHVCLHPSTGPRGPLFCPLFCL